MSNTLLQSSISTQASLSTVLALDSPPDFPLKDCPTNNGDAQASWADDFQEISKNAEGLSRKDASQERRNSVRAIRHELGTTSCSLPSSSSSTMRKNLRRPSLDLHRASDNTAVKSHLHYSPYSRAHLIAPRPQALSQYVATTQDSEFILLHSTLGHRSSSPLYYASDLSERASSPSTAPSLPPKLTDKPLEPSSPAYTILSSFVYRAPSSGSATPSSSFTSSFMIRRRDGSASTERGHGRTRRSSSPASLKFLDKPPHHCCGTCSVCVSGLPGSLLIETWKHVVPPIVLHRPMTPPAEESSSSSDSCVAKCTVQSLRKIIDDQATLQPKGQLEDKGVSSSSIYRSRLRAPPFLPRSPAPVATAGTSTATASISRLFTKGTHSSSTRPPSPRRQSAMKRSPSSSASSIRVAPTPLNSSSNILNFPEAVVNILGGGSTSSSGKSTPSKRISFAELPESYASTRPNGGSSSKFKDKYKQRQRKNGRAGGRGQNQSSAERTGWWNGWLTTEGSNIHDWTTTLARQEERMEDRTSRNWSGKMGAGFSSNLDDWAA